MNWPPPDREIRVADVHSVFEAVAHNGSLWAKRVETLRALADEPLEMVFDLVQMIGADPDKVFEVLLATHR